MAFNLKPGQSMRKRIRNAARERIDSALDEIQTKAQLPSDDAVHQTRRRLKQLRALLQLVREDLDNRTFRRENKVFG